jgi:catechol 2,3-dioxygenase-like lactoylglutathione lyase family enzyme
MAKLRHIAINCDDLETSAEFYSQAFELKEVGRAGDISSMGAIYLSDGTMNVALIKISDPDYPNAKPDGLNHIGFVVPDVDTAVARVKALGATAVVDPDAEGSGATWEMKMKTPDGVGFDLTAHGWPGISGVD